jgi:hypothetical protein
MTAEMHDGNRPELICVGCNKRPNELAEYVSAASEAHSGVTDMTADDYVWQEEGTLNRENGHFICSECYIQAGCPVKSFVRSRDMMHLRKDPEKTW